MTINEYLTTFAGLPVVPVEQEQSPADATAVAWNVSVEDFEADAEEFASVFERVLERTGPTGPLR